MSNAQVTDLYEVTMALAYVREAMTELATFSLFTRKLPPDRGFLIAAGLESAISYLEKFEIDDEDVAAFAEAVDRPDEDLDGLRGLRFTGEVGRCPRAASSCPVNRCWR